MKPAHFKEATANYGAGQAEYEPLPGVKLPGREGIVVSCWSLSLWERIVVLFTGVIWCQQMTFNFPLQPQLPSVSKPFKEQDDLPK
jgi:hypothetical protein